MSLPGRLLDLDGVRVFVHRSGTGTGAPLVLIHGFMMSHWAWRRVVPLLTAAGHEVVALDLPGFGESDRPTRREFRYDAQAYVRTIVRVLDALAIERATLVGHSMGAGIAIVAAANNPERVARLVLADPLAYAARISLEERAVLAPIVGPALFDALLTKRRMQRFMRRMTYHDPSVASDEWIDYLWERVRRPGGIEAALAALAFVADASDVQRALSAISAPTLIVWGENDRIFPVRYAERLAREIPHAELCLVPSCGHSPPEERPEDFARAVLQFLAADAPPRRATA